GVQDKDAGFVENQQQNIADAIDLLPRLTTGIDVNIKFRRIDDFEFTRECAIFDLLDIPLYHGWIVDPQDSETADAIGSKSYNTVMEELVSLETQAMDSEMKNDPDDDVDFAAATTAALGVPTPCLSRARKGDIEEETELSRVLKLSESERSIPVADGVDADVNTVKNPYLTDKPDAFTSSGDGGEPMYEGEERIMESGTVRYENQEPIYEGELIRSFMKNSASQLTIYGLFCLQDKVKERELCVFFRNNHFNTMFKYEGELYILATDQGYISQPDLVWEKLNEVRC
ncbi:protein fam63a, partial [Phtheirospermum japonicum]